MDDSPALVYALRRFGAFSKPLLATINLTVNPSSFAKSAVIRLGLILLVGCLSAFNAQVRISRFTPQPDSTNYLIGGSRMINERVDLTVEDHCQTPIDVCEAPIQPTSDIHQTPCCSIRRTPVRAFTLTLPLILSLRAPPHSV